MKPFSISRTSSGVTVIHLYAVLTAIPANALHTGTISCAWTLCVCDCRRQDIAQVAPYIGEKQPLSTLEAGGMAAKDLAFKLDHLICVQKQDMSWF